MRYQVSVLTGDAVFGRMLALEFEGWHLSVVVGEKPDPDSSAEVTIVDLDSAPLPEPEQYGYLIGFSRLPAVSADEDARRCSMILRRPFRMRLLRREVLSRLGAVALPGVATAPQERLFAVSLTPEGISAGDRTLPLTPQERTLFSALLDARGATVPRQRLAEISGIGSRGEIEVYICFLRRKLRQIAGAEMIETVRGVGYRLKSPEKSGKALDIIFPEWYNNVDGNYES